MISPFRRDLRHSVDTKMNNIKTFHFSSIFVEWHSFSARLTRQRKIQRKKSQDKQITRQRKIPLRAQISA
jgi:hypothetical protein